MVLAIVGMSWFALLPNLDLAGSERQEPGDELNAFLGRVRDTAVAEYRNQEVGIELGQDSLAWKDKRVRLPAAVSRCSINGEYPSGLQFSFHVYAAGHMDDVRLELITGQVLRSKVLEASF